jgi:hypothetical protein
VCAYGKGFFYLMFQLRKWLVPEKSKAHTPPPHLLFALCMHTRTRRYSFEKRRGILNQSPLYLLLMVLAARAPEKCGQVCIAHTCIGRRVSAHSLRVHIYRYTIEWRMLKTNTVMLSTLIRGRDFPTRCWHFQ